MMTGIPIVSSLFVPAYYICICCCITGFAIYDLFHRRVPNQALVCFLPLTLAAPLLQTAEPLTWQTIARDIAVSSAGATVGFITLLSAALAAKDGGGIGGGDIKLAAVMGIVYGPYRMIMILCIASVLAGVFVIITNKTRSTTTLALPFVPFLAIGSFVITAATIL